MAQPASERALTARVRRRLKKEPDCWFFKTVGGPFSTPGIPDFVGVVKGRGFGFELKAPKGRLRPEQVRQLAEIKEAGGVARVIRDMEDLEDALKEVRSANT